MAFEKVGLPEAEDRVPGQTSWGLLYVELPETQESRIFADLWQFNQRRSSYF